MKKFLTLAAVLAFAACGAETPTQMSTTDLPVAYAGGGPTDKATGSGMFKAADGLFWDIDFNAHEALYDRPAKGSFYAIRDDLSTSIGVANLTYVNVDGAAACFGGQITEATGAFAIYLGRYWFTGVQDGGEPEQDKVRNQVVSTFTPPSWCANLTGPFVADMVGGNIQVHLGKSYTSD